MSAIFRLRRVSTTNPASFKVAVIAVASLAGLARRATFSYPELPITSATRFAAWAENVVEADKTTAAINNRRTEIMPSPEGMNHDTSGKWFRIAARRRISEIM